MTLKYPLGRRCPGAVVARCFEECALHQNVHFFGSVVIRQIHMALAWSPAKELVLHTIDITKSEEFRILRGIEHGA
jgi:hypothetical protein